jgi:glucarate dehydratase
LRSVCRGRRNINRSNKNGLFSRHRGKFPYENGSIRVPDGPGLGVQLDRARFAQYADLYRELEPYPHDQDPARPGWAPLVPNDRWADPADDREPFVLA